MPGKWGGARRAHPLDLPMKTRMPGKWGGVRRAHPLDLPMKTRMPGKWGGMRRARPPLDPPMEVQIWLPHHDSAQ